MLCLKNKKIKKYGITFKAFRKTKNRTKENISEIKEDIKVAEKEIEIIKKEIEIKKKEKENLEKILHCELDVLNNFHGNICLFLNHILISH